MVFGAACALALGELALRFVSAPAPVVSGWRSKAPPSEKNQLGFRGRRIAYDAEDFVVVLLGDSSVEANALKFDSTPERALERHLNRRKSRRKRARVFTLGAQGYGQDQQLLVLEEYVRGFRADLVLLWQTPSNDIWNNLFPTHWPANGAPKPTFRLEKGELRGPHERMGEDIHASPLKLLGLLRRTLASRDRDGDWEARHLPPAYVPLERYDGPVNDKWQRRWDEDRGGMRRENLRSEKSHLAIDLTPRSKRMDYGVELTRKLTLEIKVLAESHHGRLAAFITKPSPPTPPNEQVYVLNGKYFRTSREQHLAILADINRDLPWFVVPVTLKDWRAAPGDRHLNERAVDQAMRNLARELEARGLLLE